MSVVTVQLGQCGNQIGCELLSLLHKDAYQPPQYTSSDASENILYKLDTLERYFTEVSTDGQIRYEAKAVLVDMEEKVVHACKQQALKSGDWSYLPSASCVRKKGSGNNWALGYHSYGKSVADDVMKLCRSEVEKCDRFAGFFILMSLAGGTGSGLGACITQSLRDEFPGAHLVNHVVWPYTSGEVIVQNYNTILTLSHLQNFSDLVIAQRNDHLHDICAKLLGIKKISLEHINQVMAHKLANMLQPATARGYQSVNTLSSIVNALGSHPAYKLASVKCIPHISERSMAYSTFLWPGLLKHLRQMLIADAAMEEGINWEIKAPVESGTNCCSTMRSNSNNDQIRRSNFNKSVSNLVILRGKDLETADTSIFTNEQLYANDTPVFTEWRQPRCFNQYKKSATLVTNSQTFIRPLNNSIEKAWDMFNARAYLHQYEKHDLHMDDFIDTFAVVEQIVSDYSRI